MHGLQDIGTYSTAFFLRFIFIIFLFFYFYSAVSGSSLRCACFSLIVACGFFSSLVVACRFQGTRAL